MMNIRESIKRILQEETDIPIRLRRRLLFIDDMVPFKIKHYYKPNTICRYESDEEFFEEVMYSVIDTMYWDYFGDIPDNSNEWTNMFYIMEKYIRGNYGDKLKEYYHINCGN